MDVKHLKYLFLSKDDRLNIHHLSCQADDVSGCTSDKRAFFYSRISGRLSPGKRSCKRKMFILILIFVKLMVEKHRWRQAADRRPAGSDSTLFNEESKHTITVLIILSVSEWIRLESIKIKFKRYVLVLRLFFPSSNNDPLYNALNIHVKPQFSCRCSVKRWCKSDRKSLISGDASIEHRFTSRSGERSNKVV